MATYNVTVVQGFQVASGLANDARYPGGTIAMQLPYFKTMGLNVTNMHPATINVEFPCQSIELPTPNFSFNKVKWHSNLPPENFKFYSCRIIMANRVYNAYIYQPQPETKIEHFQPINQLELLAPFIKNIHYGDAITLEIENITLDY